MSLRLGAADPFMPWTIVPYWSIDLFHGLSFLLCRSVQVDRHALRLLTASCCRWPASWPSAHLQLRPPGHRRAVRCPVRRPRRLRPTVLQPGALLHISLLVIIWLRFAGAGSPGCVMSTLGRTAHRRRCSPPTSTISSTSPTGALVGLLCLWLWPDEGPAAPRRCPAHHRPGAGAWPCSGLASLGCIGAGHRPRRRRLVWLMLARARDRAGGPRITPSSARGVSRNTPAATASPAPPAAGPYTLAARLNAWLWTRRRPPDEVADGVWLGRLPDAAAMEAGGFRGLVDLTANCPPAWALGLRASLPWLDPHCANAKTSSMRRPPSPGCSRRPRGWSPARWAASRSASAVAAWLIATRRAASVDRPWTMIQRAPRVVLGPAHRRAPAIPQPQRDQRWRLTPSQFYCRPRRRQPGHGRSLTG